LLESFTSISGYQAIDTFNRLKYKCFDDWQLGANSIRPESHNKGIKMTIQEAVEAAGLLRREAYITKQIVFY
jgi:hypothetical protein